MQSAASGGPGGFSLPEAVENTVSRFGLLDEGAGVLVGLSGGPDSVALLKALLLLAPRHGWRVAAAHFNHCIRGAEADEDEAFCRGLCEGEGIPFFSVKEDIPAYASENGLSLETAGRLRRYEYLESVREANGLDAIAVAHHMDDNAESVLMHLLRGSGLAGLTGIQPRRGRVIRPLLGVRRSEIIAFLEENGIPYRTDATNLLAEGTRNRLRLEVIPYLERHINPELVPSLCSAAELISRDEEFLSGLAEKALEEAFRGEGYDRASLAALPGPVRSRAIRIALARAGAPVDIERVHVEAIERLLVGRTGAELHVPHALVRVSYGLVCFEKQRAEARYFERELIVPGVTETPLGSFRTTLVTGQEGFYKTPDVGFLDADRLPGPIVVRPRRNGDRFFPIGAPGRKKLKDHYIDKKVDRRLRDALPVFACGDEAIFIPGIGASETVRVTGETVRMLRIERI